MGLKLLQSITVLVILLLATLTSCDSLAGNTRNVGDSPPLGYFKPTIVVPSDMFANGDATWTVNYNESFPGPFQVSWDFGGGADPNEVNVTAPAGSGSSSTTVRMLNNTSAPDTFTATVSVTDSLGNTGTDTATYTVGFGRPLPPSIDDISFDPSSNTISVVVSDPDDGETIDVNAVTVPDGFTLDFTSRTASFTGPFTAVFHVGLSNPFQGATGEFVFEATDGGDTSHKASIGVSIKLITLTLDRLIAVPLSNDAGTATSENNGNTNIKGDYVTVVVATGTPANPFLYMNGCGLTVEGGVQGAEGDSFDISQGAVYVANSFNVGATGGSAADGDGFWSAMPGVSFLLAPDSFIRPRSIGDGRIAIDFNVSPLAGTGQNVSSNGELFNFVMAFGKPGLYTLRFEEVNVVNRTYYSDGDLNEYFWGDISNEGVPATIQVE